MKCPFFKQVKEAFKKFGEKLRNLTKKRESESEPRECDTECDCGDDSDSDLSN